MGAIDLAIAGCLVILCILLAVALVRFRGRERGYRELLGSLPATSVLAFDRDLRITVAAGPGFGEPGPRGAELEGMSVGDLVPQAQADALLAHHRAALRGETRAFQYRSPRSGREYWIRVVPLRERDGEVEQGLTVALDLTDQPPLERDGFGHVDTVTEVTRALARSVDPATARAAICEGASRMTGAPVAALFEPGGGGRGLVLRACVGAELRGLELPLSGESGAVLAYTRAEDVFVSLAGNAAELDREFLRRARARAVLWHPVVRDRAAIGVLAIAWHEPLEAVSLQLSGMVDLLGAEAAVAISRADLLGQLEHMARTDGLTGLPNRRHWEQQLPRELAHAWREEAPICVAVLDLDHFKAYNDAHGHQAGDDLLAAAARAWQRVLRPYDVLARYGGEEFSLILPGCSAAEALALVERLRAVTPEGESCSAGIAEWDREEAPETLVGRADAALYRAKRAGRDRSVSATHA